MFEYRPATQAPTRIVSGYPNVRTQCHWLAGRRVFAMLAALVCLLSLGSVLGKSSRAEAAVARPTLQASAVKSGVVTLSGRAPDAVRVALQRRKGTEWVTVRYLNAPSHVRSGRATLRGYIPRANARVGLQRRKGTSWVRVRYLTVRQHAVTTSLPVARKTSFRLATTTQRSDARRGRRSTTTAPATPPTGPATRTPPRTSRSVAECSP